MLELRSSYSFNLYYIKGKDMIFSDFLSRQKHDDSAPHDIISISFNMCNILHENYYNIGRTDIFSTDMTTDKIKQYKATRGPQCEENLGYKYIT